MLSIILVVIIVAYLFNPYMSFIPKTEDELWKTRELSHGGPYYWKMQYCPKMNVRHPEVYNRPFKVRYYNRNVMYIQ